MSTSTTRDLIAADAASWVRFRTWLVRSSDERLISGLSGGIAARLGVRTAHVRAAFVVLTFTGLVGVVLYGLGWAVATRTAPTLATPRTLETRRMVGLGLMFVALVLALRGVGLWFGDAVVWPVLLIAFGIAAIWDRSDVTSLRGAASDTSGTSRVRAIFGAVLMFSGLAIFSGSLDSASDLGPIVIAVGITAAGFMLVFGPWVVRLAGDLANERRDRIRSEERSDMAAHLHDSVLQTLALIQRSDDPRRMITLARTQERELRTWLYSSTSVEDGIPLSVALDDAAIRVEQDHDVPVEVVVVSDIAVDDRIVAVVRAATEAMANAARHSGASKVSVFAEANDGILEVFVSDQGSGFDMDEVPIDRHGVRQSIVARMTRHGGTAEIHSDPDEGTEVHLTMPLETP